MPQGDKPGLQFCRQCGAAVPEGATLCPRCGQRWYMDRVEQQGADLWRRILEKRAAAGLSEAPPTSEKVYRCPNCMAVLKEQVSVCPHCGKSTLQAKIVPPVSETKQPEIEYSEKLDLPPEAKGLSKIKGAGQRASLFRKRRRLKNIEIIILVLFSLAILATVYFLLHQSGRLPISIDFFNPPANQQQGLTPIKPQISNIALTEITATGVTIAWSTDISTAGKVLYGKTEDYNQSAITSQVLTSQKVSLSNLEPATDYHFVIIATDNASNELSRSNDHMFKTLAASNPAPPIITQYKVVPADIGAIIRWTTDKPCTSQILYGTDQQCSNTTPVDSQMVTEHSVRISSLEANTRYYYRIKSVDADGNTAITDPPDMFNTLISVPMGYRVGERAPDFTLPIFKSLDTVSLRSFKGQKVLLTFWAVYCPECDRELALLQSLKNRNLPGVNIIVVFLESKPDDIEKTIASYKAARGELTLPVVVDMYKTAAHLYNVEKLPCTFFIDGDMIIRQVDYGNFNIDQVEKALKEL